MHLSIDSAVAHLDLEQAMVAPGVVPGIYAEPVVNSTFVTPADDLNSVATELSAGRVLIDT